MYCNPGSAPTGAATRGGYAATHGGDPATHDGDPAARGGDLATRGGVAATHAGNASKCGGVAAQCAGNASTTLLTMETFMQTKKSGRLLPALLAMLALIAAGFFTACPTEGEAVTVPETPVEPPFDTSKITGEYFTAAPELTVTAGTTAGQFTYRFAAAEPSDSSISYKLYVLQGDIPANQTSDVIVGTNNVKSLLNHFDKDTDKTVTGMDTGRVYTVIVVAEKDAANKAYSKAATLITYSTLPDVDPSQEDGKLVSVGRSTTGKTYYIDAARGNDSNDGRSAERPWKTFKNANGKVFQPGDHILLEANSVWNGESVTPANYTELSANYAANDKVAMLAPKGSGVEGKPIVIDLYEVRGTSGNERVYYSANQRPIINGNGTPSVGANPYFMTAPITVVDGEYWEVYNMELTNSFKFPDLAATPGLRDTHWYDNDVIKRLATIYFAATGNAAKRHIVIKNNYCHDAQSENSRTPANNAFGETYAYLTTSTSSINSRRLKVSGGIAVAEIPWTPDGTRIENTQFAWHDLLIEGNIVKRVAQTGLRNTSQVEGEKIIFRGNYIEAVGGDAFVLTRTKGLGENRSMAEYNIVKDTSANPNNGTANFAAAWAIYTLDTTLRYNEVYGTVYGYQDSEAFDFDGGCKRSVYEYNYSHHNAGGAILFMSAGQGDCVYRFNISANDGIGTIGLYNIHIDGTAPADAMPVSNTQSSYTAFPFGQSIFHYATGTQSTASSATPLIHNNTFYVGDGFTVGLYGQNTDTARDYYVRFYNNILIKAGAGTLYLARAHRETNGVAGGSINSPAHFKNNILWGYELAAPTVGVEAKISNGNTVPIATLMQETYKNRFVNPDLGIQSAANAALLRAQRDTAFPEADYNDPAKLALFTGKARLRNRVSMFAPADANSPAVKITGGKGPGMVIPVGTDATIDNAWNGGDYAADFRIKEDLFGTAITDDNWPIGAAAAPFTPTGADPYP
jgi:hypothetical protein